ncbi:MAG: WYL domain-containing protein [Leptospirales bacterium]|nr:WYL domain-containing protein [Leptospirales bacterium]
MAKMERLGCLYLTFLNHPEGLSFSRIKEQLAPAYTGDAESARRKFERDKDELKALGMELDYFGEGQPLPNGSLARGHVYIPRDEIERLPDLKLNPEEASALAGILLYAIENPDNPRNQELYRSAAAKLLYKTPTLLAGTPTEHWAPAQGNADHLPEIRKAIQKRLLLKIEYPQRDGSILEREVEGRGLISHRGRWCLVAFARDAKAIRYFYLDRITKARATKVQFKPDPKFSILDHSLHPLTISLHDPVTIQLTFEPESKDALLDFLAGLPQKLWKLDGHSIAVTTTNRTALFGFMLRNPGTVAGLGPVEILADFEKHINSIRTLYGK